MEESRLVTVAESSDFTRTSLHAEVVSFCEAVAARASAHVRLVSMGTSGEGLTIPVLVLSAERAFTPEEAHASGKPVVLVLANIHAGEVEGKEAVLSLAAAIAGGAHPEVLRDLTLLLVPDYNPDGNDRIDVKNRALDLAALEGQVGPVGGVGTRHTGPQATRAGSMCLNLNRDFTKLEAVESRHLARLFSAWRPHVVVDCHTTDGSVHGYDLTFDTSHAVASGPTAPVLHVRDHLLPDLARRVRASSGHRTGFYGNYHDPREPGAGWETYPALPRYGSHYRGLAGRMDVLLETYSYLDFRARYHAMRSTLGTLLALLAAEGASLVRIVREAEADTIARGSAPRPDDRVAVSYALPRREASGALVFDYPVAALRDIEIESWDLASIREHRIPGRERCVYPTTYYARFVPTKEVARPRGYVVPAAEVEVISRLGLHGLESRVLEAGESFDVDEHTVVARERTESPDVGSAPREETVFSVRTARTSFRASHGDVLVTTAQPFAGVAIHLLEPESDDGLARWGLFDHVGVGALFPVRRVV